MKILLISDMQNGFVAKDGSLYMNKADTLIPATNEFLSTASGYDFVFLTMDTHFEEEYYTSAEGKMFPPHCFYDTYDWKLAINPYLMKDTPKYYMLKNSFDMWKHLSSKERERKKSHLLAYNSLYRVTSNINEFDDSIQRDDFFKIKIPNFNDLDVHLIGVASDYCNRYATDGFLKRGAKVSLIENLTKGINQETKDIIHEPQYEKYLKSGQLTTITV